MEVETDRSALREFQSMLDKGVLRPIKGLPAGKYFISEQGGVWSGNGQVPRKLDAHVGEYGYWLVILAVPQYLAFRVDRLVAQTFCETPGHGQTEVLHMNGDLLDDAHVNLRWGTREEAAQIETEYRRRVLRFISKGLPVWDQTDASQNAVTVRSVFQYFERALSPVRELVLLPGADAAGDEHVVLETETLTITMGQLREISRVAHYVQSVEAAMRKELLS